MSGTLVPLAAPEAPRGEEERVQVVGRRGRAGRNKDKLWCHLCISPELLAPGFDVNKKIIGRGGSCTKGIFTATGVRVRLRGRGSGFLEPIGHCGRLQEAPVPLTLAVSTERRDVESFRRAVAMAVELLRGIEGRFRAFCRDRRRGPQLVAPGRAFWVGDISSEGLQCCGAELKGVPVDRPGQGGDAPR